MASYRIMVVVLLIVITYYFTGDLGQTTTISIVFNVAGSAIYYVYERMWGRIEWGRALAIQPHQVLLRTSEAVRKLESQLGAVETRARED
jgi:uncharacterized membrane protein